MSTNKKNICVVILMAVCCFGFFLWCLLKPADAYSDAERRELDQFPELSLRTIWNGDFMGNFEEYTLDQFPLRGEFRTLKAVTNLVVFAQKDNNKLYLADGHIGSIEYPLQEEALDYAAGRFTHVYEKYLAGTDVQIYGALIPDKNAFLAEVNGYPAMDYEAFAAILAEGTPFMEYIPIADLLELEDYYRTDPHWRQECLQDVARAIGAGMGVELNASYEVKTLEQPYYGTYYDQAALPMNPETLAYLTNDMLDRCTVYDHENGRETAIYDLEKANGKDLYEVYLSGPLSLITIENPEASTDKELIVFRDSFGSSLVPLLAEAYAKITLVDIRYLPSDRVGQFVEFDDQDVLFLYSTMVLNNSNTLK